MDRAVARVVRQASSTTLKPVVRFRSPRSSYVDCWLIPSFFCSLSGLFPSSLSCWSGLQRKRNCVHRQLLCVLRPRRFDTLLSSFSPRFRCLLVFCACAGAVRSFPCLTGFCETCSAGSGLDSTTSSNSTTPTTSAAVNLALTNFTFGTVFSCCSANRLPPSENPLVLTRPTYFFVTPGPV
jgi:hypothetical protein